MGRRNRNGIDRLEGRKTGMRCVQSGMLGRPRLKLAVILPVLWLMGASGPALAQFQRTPLQLLPADVLPTGNEWISLPDIRAEDGALTTFNVLSMHHRGLMQVEGDAGGPVLQPYFTADGKPSSFTTLHGS